MGLLVLTKSCHRHVHETSRLMRYGFCEYHFRICSPRINYPVINVIHELCLLSVLFYMTCLHGKSWKKWKFWENCAFHTENYRDFLLLFEHMQSYEKIKLSKVTKSLKFRKDTAWNSEITVFPIHYLLHLNFFNTVYIVIQ